MKRAMMKRKQSASNTSDGNETKRYLQEHSIAKVCSKGANDESSGDGTQGDKTEHLTTAGAADIPAACTSAPTETVKSSPATANKEILWKCTNCEKIQLMTDSETICNQCKETQDTAAPSSSSHIITPSVNDVLIGKGSHIFNHIGNRRFRILVEINFHNYFSNDQQVNATREEIVRAVISSIEGNHPRGRFLIPQDGDTTGEQVDSIQWKLATSVEAEAKVHSAFLAAGCFLVSKAAALEEMGDGVQTQWGAGAATAASGDLATAASTSMQANEAGNNVANVSTDSIASKGRRGSSSSVSSTGSLGQDSTSIKCPEKIRDFIKQPPSQYFIIESSSPQIGSSAASPANSDTYLVPSNYDILCGTGQHYFHHIGNRRFRILIEMNVHRYHKLLQSNDETKQDSIEKLVTETLVSLSKCDPPGRFLGMDLSTGRWRILNPIFAQLKTEQTFFECMKVTERKKRLAIEQQVEERMAFLEQQVEREAILNANNAMADAENKACIPCQVPPLPLFGVNFAMLQHQARTMLRSTRNLEGVDLSSFNNLASMPTNPPLGMNFCNVWNNQQNNHGFHMQNLQQEGQGVPPRAVSRDVMDVVGGMLSLGAHAHRRSSI